MEGRCPRKRKKCIYIYMCAFVGVIFLMTLTKLTKFMHIYYQSNKREDDIDLQFPLCLSRLREQKCYQ